MDSYSLTEAQARLSELIDKAQAGEAVEITRDGKPVAKVVPTPVTSQAPRKPIDWEALRQLRERMPMQEESAGEFVRRMRDTDRY